MSSTALLRSVDSGSAWLLNPTAGLGVALIGEPHTGIPTTATSVGRQGEGLSLGLILYYSRAR